MYHSWGPLRVARHWKLGPLTWAQPLGDPTCPYNYRWVLDLGKLGSVRVHHWVRSDDKRAKHDHPSDFVTLVISGGYVDRSALAISTEDDVELINGLERMGRWSLRHRKATHIHTVDVDPGGCWTLLYFWPPSRTWGFWSRPKSGIGRTRWFRAAKWFDDHGHHPCEQP